MSATKLLRHLRLFPAVIVVGSGLLAIKSFGLVHNAYAQTAMTGQVSKSDPQETQVAVADPSIDDADSNSAAAVGVLTSLSKRRTELDVREQSLDMQANLIAAAEKRVDDKIASLKVLQGQIQALLTQRDTAEQTQINTLVKTYSSMKPADAARIFNQLDETVELNVAALMKADVLGAILAKMQADVAQKLTVRLANRLKLPDPPPVAPAAATLGTDPAATPSGQTAALDPAAATPTPVTPAPTTPVLTTTAPATSLTPTPAKPAKQAAMSPAPAAKPATTPAIALAPVAKQASTTPSAPAPASSTPAATLSKTPAPKANGA